MLQSTLNKEHIFHTDSKNYPLTSTTSWGFPGGSVVKNPPANAGDTGLIQEDPTCHKATKTICHNYQACSLEPVLCIKRSHRNEKRVHLVAMKTQHSHK